MEGGKSKHAIDKERQETAADGWMSCPMEAGEGEEKITET
jgi:hypothetical protein